MVPAAHGRSVVDGRVFDGRVVDGGPSRAASVRAGLAALPPEAELVIVHDGVRPFASPALFASVLAAVRDGADAAIPALAVTDTLKRVDGGRVVETLDRATVVAVQTPQAFRLATLRAAHADHGEASDDAALVEAIGGSVVWVPGAEDNRKLTTAEDLWWFNAKLAAR